MNTAKYPHHEIHYNYDRLSSCMKERNLRLCWWILPWLQVKDQQRERLSIKHANSGGTTSSILWSKHQLLASRWLRYIMEFVAQLHVSRTTCSSDLTKNTDTLYWSHEQVRTYLRSFPYCGIMLCSGEIIWAVGFSITKSTDLQVTNQSFKVFFRPISNLSL